MTGEEPQITLVIPFLNERDALPSLVEKLSKFFQSATLPAVEVIFVDDGSTDGCAELLKQIDLPFQARLIRLSRNYGTHAALRAGILHARGQWISNNYADLQDPLEVLPQLYELGLKGADIVWAHRRSTKAAFVERIFSEINAGLVRRLIDPRYPEMGLDIFMINKKVKNELDQCPESNTSLFLQIMSLGFSQSHLSYDKQERTVGKSKWTFGKKLKLLIDTFVGFSYAPIRFVTVVGLALFIAGILLSLYVIALTLMGSGLVTGYSKLACIVLIGFGTTNISLGIIAEYLWLVLDASRNRKVYIIDSVVELKPASTA